VGFPRVHFESLIRKADGPAAFELRRSVSDPAKRRTWVSSNPAEDVERVSVTRSGDFNILSPVEVESVARAATSEQDAAIFTVAAFTGLRLGELRALRWRDVDLAKQTVIVRGSGSQQRRLCQSELYENLQPYSEILYIGRYR
jgi:integrase